MTQLPYSPRRYILLSLAFMLVIVMLTGAMSVYVLADQNFRRVLDFVRAAVDINRYYEEPVNWNDAFNGSMNGMLDDLDRFTIYHPPRQFTRINEEFSGSYVGIGVTVIRHDDGLLVMSVREGGPAAEVGMQSGDVIIKVDSVMLAGLGVQESSQFLRGRAGTKVEVTLVRSQPPDTVSVAITRRAIEFHHIAYAGMTADSLIYIRLLDFDAGTSRDLRHDLDSLLGLPGNKPQGIIMDLRGNPGGLFAEAYQSANLFLKGGQFIVGTKARSRWEDEKHYSSGEDMTNGLPMAILVDGGSASSAEIFSGSMQQLHRAILVGDTTFGKGLVQGFTQYPDGSALRMTIARYYLAGGVFLNRVDSIVHDTGNGLVPDYPASFVERDPFPLALDRSLLLNSYANSHADEIIQASRSGKLDDSFVDRFMAYARQNDFAYHSPIFKGAHELEQTADSESTSSATHRAVEDIMQRAEAVDSAAYTNYRDYIKFRLTWLAYEHDGGLSEAYAKAIVPNRKDIRYAAQLLKEGATNRPPNESAGPTP